MTHVHRLIRARAGFTLLEMLLGATVLAILAKTMVAATSSVSHLTESGNLESRVQRDSDRALTQIMEDLRMSGFHTVNDRVYPHVFTDGVPDSTFREFAHKPAPQGAREGEPDFGPMCSIVLCTPSDLDGNGRPEIDVDGDGVPELDGDGDGVVSDLPEDVSEIWDEQQNTISEQSRLVWSHEDIAYVVTRSAAGDNELVRLVGNGAGGRDVLARSVERLTFETVQPGSASVSAGTVRVRIDFRATTESGHLHKSFVQALVRLRNNNG
ncbi:MAG: prepilin-type N-terminal cleavage/methylation domain-containing protein [Planctomycetota bacterium]|nr:prepilin-type N-terminal cleavage/methylation domain-containing protein [Planctomycetota bacterium]MDG1983620.1 prepilin-type N-terminal cleavage/methylation domain-containing protein [Planctomycetota bacterium]